MLWMYSQRPQRWSTRKCGI